MEITIQKWGHSAGVRIPSGVLKQIGAGIGESLKVVITPEGDLILKPQKKRLSLEELVQGMGTEPLPRVEGWDAMPAAGLEMTAEEAYADKKIA